jgi:hypothetical protein
VSACGVWEGTLLEQVDWVQPRLAGWVDLLQSRMVIEMMMEE